MTSYVDLEYAAFVSPAYYGNLNRLTVWDALEHHEKVELEEVLYLAETEKDEALELEGYDLEGAYAMEYRSFAL